MKTFDTAPEPDRAILVGVGEDLTELVALCESCNIVTVGTIEQKVREIDPAFYIGSGKVAELKILVEEKAATCVVFDVELSGSKVRNLEKELCVTVLDRSLIILDIFAQRAQSAEGKLQVELAQLKYNLPRLIGTGGVLSKMKTSVGMRGPGEKKLELDKRKIRDEILELEKKLQKLRDTRDLANKQGTKSGKPRVCLVGYTNSGKSTLLNTITKSNVLARDQLFATLDPKTANVFVQTETGGVQFLLTDTVGFIDRLPHEFIRAFESTLDSVRNSNLLLHIVDISNPDYEKQISVVTEVLKNIGASAIPTILVLNKIDNAKGFGGDRKAPECGGFESELVKGGAWGGTPHKICISAKNNVNIDLLKQKIVCILNT